MQCSPELFISNRNFQPQAAACSSQVLRLATETIPLDSVQVTPGQGFRGSSIAAGGGGGGATCSGAEANGEAVAAWESPARAVPVVPEVGANLAESYGPHWPTIALEMMRNGHHRILSAYLSHLEF